MTRRGYDPYLVASSGPFPGKAPEGTRTIARLPGFPLVLRSLRKDLGLVMGDSESLVHSNVQQGTLTIPCFLDSLGRWLEAQRAVQDNSPGVPRIRGQSSSPLSCTQGLISFLTKWSVLGWAPG